MKRRGKSLLTGGSSSGINSLSAGATRKFLNGKITAKRIVIPDGDIAEKTAVHYLNPRNQEALNLESVRDILPSIEENGVHQEGVAVKCADTGKLLLLDASRRRFCCMQVGVDLPIWELQGDLEDSHLLAIINDSQEVKRWSYPEHASYLLKIAEQKGIDIENTTLPNLADSLAIGRESLRKRLEAHKISPAIRQIFIDYEGIPNSFYSKLAKLQRNLELASKNVNTVISKFSAELDSHKLSHEISKAQHETLALLTQHVEKSLGKKKSGSAWTTVELAEFNSRKTFAKMSKTADGQCLKFEFSRSLNAGKRKELESFVKELLAK